jgi:hypothetical protein
MGLTERIALIRKIEELRGSTVMCFLTGLQQNVPSQIAGDSVPSSRLTIQLRKLIGP